MSNIESFLQWVPLFSNLKPEELQSFIPYFSSKSYERGQTIFLEQEKGNEFYIIESGMVKIFRIQKGREVILAIFREGDYFGEMSVLDENEVRSANAEALEPTRLYVLKSADFVNILLKNPEFMLKLLQTSWIRLRKANDMIKDLTTLDARSRILKTLERIGREHGYHEGNDIHIHIRLTHQQLADMSNTVRETVTKTLLELQREGKITINRRKVILHGMRKKESD